MRAYLVVTGVIFALITALHLARMLSEPRVFKEPDYLVLAVLAAGMSGWAAWLLRQMKSSGPRP